MLLRASLIAAALSACTAPNPPAPRRPPVARSGVVELERIALALPVAVSGLSDLGHDGDGRLLAIAERHRAVVAMDLRGGSPRVLPLVGVPDGLDTESIAYLGDGRLAIGTESDAGRPDERILLATLAADGVAVEREGLALPLGPWSTASVDNGGVEGMCAADGILLAAIEAPLVEGDARFAPLGRLDFARRAWTAFRLRLTTATGKISALQCRARADGDLDVLAIERHYEVIRVLGFRLAPRAAGQTIVPVVRADLADLIRPGENVEGIEWLSAGELALVTDNDHGRPDGPSLFLRVRLAAAD